jgi:hypothetical protein
MAAECCSLAGPSQARTKRSQWLNAKSCICWSRGSSAVPLAKSITQEPGFISKIWTENPRTGEAGGIYLFEDEASALAYAKMHEQRVLAMGASAVQYKLFDVDKSLSRITRGIA